MRARGLEGVLWQVYHHVKTKGKEVFLWLTQGKGRDAV